MGAYDHWEMKTSKKVVPMIREWADAVFFANYKTRVVEVDKKKKAQGGKRVMYTNHTPFWDAKNRYGLPDEVPFEFLSIAHIFSTFQTKAAGRQEQPTDTAEPSATSGKQGNKEPEEKEKTTAADDGRGNLADASDETKVDKRIPKRLRDLMIMDDVDEWNLQMVVNERQPNVFPYDMQVKDYPLDFIDGWIIPCWSQIVSFIEESKKNLPFS